MSAKQQSELDNLVREVIKKRDRIIPIIGDDAFEGRICRNNEEYKFPLQRWIAEKLFGDDVSEEWKEMVYKEGYRGLDIMLEEYRNQYDDEASLADLIDDGLDKQTLSLRKDVKDFLMAGKFEVIVTTSPFHILEREINTSKTYTVSSFAPSATKIKHDKNTVSSVQEKQSRAEETLKLPSIYQIFGDSEGEHVIGEETLLKYLHNLNQTSTEKGFGASPLVKYIKDKGQDNKGLGLFMPIGCNNLPNWIFRFLWYPFSQECLIGGGSNNGGIWHKHSTDENFYKFLKIHKFKTFSGSTDVLKENNTDYDPVLEKLTIELNKLNKNIGDLRNYISSFLQVQSSDDGNWDYFISYAKEDESFAKKTYDILTTICNKKVWMDSRGGINAGDKYWDAIQYGIDHSERFLFIITDSYLRKAVGKNCVDETGVVSSTGVFTEIEKIGHHVIDSRKDGHKGNCIPLIKEGTRVTYTDNKGILHKDEILQSGVLEKLPFYKEYEVMQTDKLFHHTQDLICSEEALEFNLVNLFK